VVNSSFTKYNRANTNQSLVIDSLFAPSSKFVTNATEKTVSGMWWVISISNTPSIAQAEK
jgi:hypothetical protein